MGRQPFYLLPWQKHLIRELFGWMRADGTDVKRLTPDAFPHNDFASVYSPRGDRIAYASDRNYPDLCCADLFAIGASGGAADLIDVGLPSPGVFNASWGTSPPIP